MFTLKQSNIGTNTKTYYKAILAWTRYSLIVLKEAILGLEHAIIVRVGYTVFFYIHSTIESFQRENVSI